MRLRQVDIEFFEQHGYLVMEDFVSKDACEALSHRANEIVEAFNPSESVSIFTTNEQTRHSDSYFLESGDKIRCFFEEEAFGENGELRQAKSKSINKIGHAMHDLDPVFENFSFDNRQYYPGVDENFIPDGGVRVYGVWNFTQKETGKPVSVKYYAVSQYNDEGQQTASLEWFDQGGAFDQLEE